MNPCPENKQLISWMCASALERERASALEKHFDSCPGCRAYHGQMSALTARLQVESTLPEANLSAGFHAAMVRRICGEKQLLSSSGLLAAMQSWWRAARTWPAFAATLGMALLMVTLLLLKPAPVQRHPWPGALLEYPGRAVKVERPATLASYRTAAAASAEALEALLARENKPFSLGRTYKVSSQERFALEN